MQKSVNSLSDGSYDMVDDVSDLSSDDHDTVSIASTDNIGDVDERENDQESPYSQIAGVLDDMQSLPVHRYADHQDASKASLDLDEPTPQQSVMTVTYAPESPLKQVEDEEIPITTSKEHVPAAQGLSLYTLASNTLFRSACSFVLVCIILRAILPLAYPALSKDMQAEHEVRQLRLARSIADITPSQTFNLSHLLPMPVATGKSLLGSNLYRTSEVRYQAVASNQLVVSLPRVDDYNFPQPTSISVARGDMKLDVDTSRLIDGVHAIALHPQDAFGLVTVEIVCQSPKLAVTITHDFGQPIMHAVRALAGRVATTDLSAFIDQAAISAQKIEQRTKELATVVRDEFVRDLHASRERALSIVFDLKALTSRNRSLPKP